MCLILAVFRYHLKWIIDMQIDAKELTSLQELIRGKKDQVRLLFCMRRMPRLWVNRHYFLFSFRREGIYYSIRVDCFLWFFFYSSIVIPTKDEIEFKSCNKQIKTKINSSPIKEKVKQPSNGSPSDYINTFSHCVSYYTINITWIIWASYICEFKVYLLLFKFL